MKESEISVSDSILPDGGLAGRPERLPYDRPQTGGGQTLTFAAGTRQVRAVRDERKSRTGQFCFLSIESSTEGLPDATPC